jgi:hypothetical protein
VAASLRAGVPTIVCPLLADQYYWAHRLAGTCSGGIAVLRSLTILVFMCFSWATVELGVGPRQPVPLRDLRAAADLKRLLIESMAPNVVAAARGLGAGSVPALDIDECCMCARADKRESS